MTGRKKVKKVRKKSNKTKDATSEEGSIDQIPPVKKIKRGKKIIRKKARTLDSKTNTNSLDEPIISDEFSAELRESKTLTISSVDNNTTEGNSIERKTKIKRKIAITKKSQSKKSLKKQKSSKICKSPKKSKSVIQNNTDIIKITPFPEIEYQNLQIPSIENNELQNIIENAPESSQIIIPSGFYQVELVIKKPISLIAQGEVILLSPGTNHTVIVNSIGVSIKGFKICQKYSEIHSSIYVENGSLRLTDCFITSEYAPAIILSSQSISHIFRTSFSSVKAPPIFAFENSMISAEDCKINDSSSSGVVLCGYSTAKFFRCEITCNQKSGFLCKEKSNLLCDGCSITGCGENGMEIGSSGTILIKSSNIEGCEGCGIITYSNSVPSIMNMSISYCKGPAIKAFEKSSLYLSQNKYISCGQPSLLYFQDDVRIKSSDDSFIGTDGGIYINGNSTLNLSNATFDSLLCGIIIDGPCTTEIDGSKFQNIQKTSISAENLTELNIKNTDIKGSGEDGIYISGIKKLNLNNVIIEKSGISGIDAMNSTSIILNKVSLLNNRNAGLVLSQSEAEISDSKSNGNGIVAFEIRGCKGKFQNTEIKDNACGIICIDKGQASIENCSFSENKQSALLLLNKSVTTLRHSKLVSNGIICMGKSYAKLRTDTLSNCRSALQVVGNKTKGDIENCCIEKCQCGILASDNSSIDINKTTFKENMCAAEARLGASINSKGCTYKRTKGESSLVILSKSKLSCKNESFEEAGKCAIYSDTSEQLEVENINVSKCQIAGIVLHQCKNSSISSSNFNKNGRAAMIVSGTGSQRISDISAKGHSDAAVILSNGSDPKLDKIESDCNVSLII